MNNIWCNIHSHLGHTHTWEQVHVVSLAGYASRPIVLHIGLRTAGSKDHPPLHFACIGASNELKKEGCA
jgi:hypothetical protein